MKRIGGINRLFMSESDKLFLDMSRLGNKDIKISKIEKVIIFFEGFRPDYLKITLSKVFRKR